MLLSYLFSDTCFKKKKKTVKKHAKILHNSEFYQIFAMSIQNNIYTYYIKSV